MAQGISKEKKGDRDIFRLDVNNMMADILGAGNGITVDMIKAVHKEVSSAHQQIKERRAEGKMGFTELPYQGETVDLINQTADNISKSFENFVVLGIGGSALGPIAIHTALLSDFYNFSISEKRKHRPRIFVLDNIDPDRIESLMDFLDDKLDKTIFNVVTKSGGTAETLANFLVFRDRLRRRLRKDKVSDHFLVTTDPESGTLRQIAIEEGYQIVTIPKGVGGRFSVFTPVGLLPAAVAGIDIHSLLAGAREMDRLCQNEDIWENPAYLKGTLDYVADRSAGKKIQVMIPYSHRLRDVADWFRQLWAESLGKKYNQEGKEVYAGTTPVKALGVTDQHSQLQLYLEGPNDKVITFLSVEEHSHQTQIPRDFNDKEGVAYLGGHSVNELFEAERLATQFALLKAGRMTNTITLGRISPFTLGQLFYFFEMETAFAGFLYGINPFDQPGVEEGKRATYGMMGRPGFGGKKEEVTSMINKKNPQYIIETA
ncbi:MAG: glucose-6-phosphate isomerase [bacterium]